MFKRSKLARLQLIRELNQKVTDEAQRRINADIDRQRIEELEAMPVNTVTESDYHELLTLRQTAV